MSEHARGTFEVRITPEDGEPTQVSRFRLEKTYAGDAVGTGSGLMLSAGDPATGSAGYVALEVAEVSIGERSGSFCLQQLGVMDNRDQSLTYLVVPGSGTGDFAGVTGRLELDILDDAHHYELVLDLAEV